MIETWLQVSCDGCDDDDSTFYAAMPNTTRAEFRASLKDAGWRCYGSLDYCPRCVKRRIHLKRKSIYDSTPTE